VVIACASSFRMRDSQAFMRFSTKIHGSVPSADVAPTQNMSEQDRSQRFLNYSFYEARARSPYTACSMLLPSTFYCPNPRY
jgi:hypothetical protein